mmetsp:Transcript_97640/g.276752  ORF Transcript_97640/g.276752 Transcript_97640/m.276752 type:complete len:310 (+) Transcript_97640:1497-2426(+)
MAKSSSERSSSAAPASTPCAPRFKAVITKSRSWRRSPLAPASASPLTIKASRTNARSSRRWRGAFSRKAGSWPTAWRTNLRSAQSVPVAYLAAWPPLAETAAYMSSLSPLTSQGASESSLQSASTSARQLAPDQLLSAPASGAAIGLSAGSSARAPLLMAAATTPCRIGAIVAAPPVSSFSRIRPSFLAASMYLSCTCCSSSCSRKSPLKPNSFRIFAGSFPLTIRAALAFVRRTRLAIRSRFAAIMSSKNSSLSTFTKVASHFDAPQSSRLSLGSGSSNSPGEFSRWYWRYSTTLPRTLDFRGSAISS